MLQIEALYKDLLEEKCFRRRKRKNACTNKIKSNNSYNYSHFRKAVVY